MYSRSYLRYGDSDFAAAPREVLHALHVAYQSIGEHRTDLYFDRGDLYVGPKNGVRRWHMQMRAVPSAPRTTLTSSRRHLRRLGTPHRFLIPIMLIRLPTPGSVWWHKARVKRKGCPRA